MYSTTKYTYIVSMIERIRGELMYVISHKQICEDMFDCNNT